MECAADFIESEEWNESSERESVMAAYAEVGKRLRRMARRANNKIESPRKVPLQDLLHEYLCMDVF
jgi:hypothetical protein